jgi:hypothetical protein
MAVPLLTNRKILVADALMLPHSHMFILNKIIKYNLKKIKTRETALGLGPSIMSFYEEGPDLRSRFVTGLIYRPFPTNTWAHHKHAADLYG